MSSPYGLANPPPNCDFTTSNLTAPPGILARACTASNEADVVGPAYYECCAGSTPVVYNNGCQIWCDIKDGFLYEANTSASHLTIEFNACIMGALQGAKKTNVTYNATCISPFVDRGKTGAADSTVRASSGALLLALVGLATFLPGVL